MGKYDAKFVNAIEKLFKLANLGYPLNTSREINERNAKEVYYATCKTTDLVQIVIDGLGKLDAKEWRKMNIISPETMSGYTFGTYLNREPFHANLTREPSSKIGGKTEYDLFMALGTQGRGNGMTLTVYGKGIEDLFYLIETKYARHIRKHPELIVEKQD